MKKTPLAAIDRPALLLAMAISGLGLACNEVPAVPADRQSSGASEEIPPRQPEQPEEPGASDTAEVAPDTGNEPVDGSELAEFSLAPPEQSSSLPSAAEVDAMLQRVGSEAADQSDLETPLCVVNGRPIELAAHRYLVQMIQTQIETAPVPRERRAELLATVEEDTRNRLISMELMAQAARLSGLDQNEESREMLGMVIEEVVPQTFLMDYSNEALEAVDLEQYYTEHQQEFGYDQVDLRMIMVEDEATAQTVNEALQSGQDFEALAAIHNTDPQLKSSGGDFLQGQGPVELSEMPPEVQNKLGKLQSGQTTAPFQPAPGQDWTLLHVKDRQSGNYPLEEVRAQLVAKIKSEAVEALMKTLQSEASVIQGDQPAPENAQALAEGETVAFWIDGTPYSEAYLTARIGPRMAQQQASFQQQLMAQLAQVPAEQQGAFMEYMQQQWTQRSAQLDLQLRNEQVLRILLTQRAAQLGFSEAHPRVQVMKGVMENELLSSVYFSQYMQEKQAAGEDVQSGGAALRLELENQLWTEAVIEDADGVAIPSPFASAEP